MAFNLFEKIGLAKPAVSWLPPTVGVHHFDRVSHQGKVRAHLRIDPDESGVLIVNAARMYHLNPTAAAMAWLFLNGVNSQEAEQILARHFKETRSHLRHDYSDTVVKLESFLDPQGQCPICDFDVDTIQPFSKNPSAPYRMDLAITYRCNNECTHCYNARVRNYPEMSTDQWKQVLEKVWQVGIPHVVFTGGEPTLRKDLPELIEFANNLGMIAGINTNGRRLRNADFVETLVEAGLDHVQITLESHDPSIHDEMVAARGAWNETVEGIRMVLKQPSLYMMTNTTLLKKNSPYLPQTLQFLQDLGVPTIGLNALIYSGAGATTQDGIAEELLPDLLTQARDFTEQSGQRLIWYTPTQYCHFDPLLLDLGVKGCTAALYNMCVEPDGAVLPCQSYYQSLGNILTQPWDSIWNHELAKSLRSRKDVPAACRMCDVLAECGGGCPLARDHCSTYRPIPLQTF